MLRVAVPDLVSNSYFPVIAAVELGLFKEQGLDVELVMMSPLEDCVDALRSGRIQLLGASAHAPLLSFPDWRGAKLLCAQAQGTYWHLVMRADLKVARGDLPALRGRRIAAVPFVGRALREILTAVGIDVDGDDISISVPARARRANVNFGVAAAEALKEGEIDGFFANGMGAELAIRSGLGTLVLDVRRGDGPDGCFGYTFAAVGATDEFIRSSPSEAAAVIRGIRNVQARLRRDPGLAGTVGRKLFPAAEAGLIGDVVARDLPYYDCAITPETISSMNRYCQRIGLLDRDARYDDVVAAEFQDVRKPDAGSVNPSGPA